MDIEDAIRPAAKLFRQAFEGQMEGDLEKATRASRYESPHYPRLNLGRAFLVKQMYSRALEEFEAALEIEPDDETARQAVATIKRKLN